ncbi:hemerythrin domain-containing protein [Nocardioides sp. JQ2195]|uniref:hemerythrin domain-containing protein n=1 Tax=Nocardioides sp. JQ2195 TaxID=2592334 RepID=UPI0023F9F422|nr:hemerythrin domain-containing protein [Nocardioides sp. JQ2195]
MCEHCGCRGVPPIAELMDEHYALLDDAHEVRRALGAGDRAGASRLMERLVAHLDVHVRREERGIFTAMRSQGEFVEEVQQLEGEHRSLDAAIGGLDPEDPGFDDVVSELFRELSEHIDRENLGIFPVSVVTLGASGWELVQQARDELPSFLPSLHD